MKGFGTMPSQAQIELDNRYNELKGVLNRENTGHIPRISADMLETGVTPLRCQQVSREFREFTYQDAVNYLNLPRVKGERAISAAALQVLYTALRKGLYNYGAAQIATAMFRRREFKINGQKTALAFALYGGEDFVTPVPIDRIVYRVTSWEQLNLLYASYDSGQSRTKTHLTKALAVDRDFADGFKPALTERLVKGFLRWRFETDTVRSRVSAPDRVALISGEYAVMFTLLGQFIAAKVTDTKLQSAAVVGAMWATFLRAPGLAEEFWTSVAAGVGMTDPRDPRLCLRGHLYKMLVTVNGGCGKIYNTEEIYKVCLMHWNKWMRGQQGNPNHLPKHKNIPPARPEVLCERG